MKEMQQNFPESDLGFTFQDVGVYDHFSGFPDDADVLCGCWL